MFLGVAAATMLSSEIDAQFFSYKREAMVYRITATNGSPAAPAGFPALVSDCLCIPDHRLFVTCLLGFFIQVTLLHLIQTQSVFASRKPGGLCVLQRDAVVGHA